MESTENDIDDRELTKTADEYEEPPPIRECFSFLVSPPSSACLYPRSQQLHLLRIGMFRTIAGTLIGFIVFVMCSAMYLGSAWQPLTKNLTVEINQADPGVMLPPNGTYVNLGDFLVSTMIAARVPDSQTRFADFTVSATPGIEHIESLQRQCEDQDYWATMQIPANFTRNYLLGIRGLTDYTNNNITLFINQGRHQTGANSLRAALDSLLRRINSNFALLAPQLFGINMNAADL